MQWYERDEIESVAKKTTVLNGVQTTVGKCVVDNRSSPLPSKLLNCTVLYGETNYGREMSS